MATGHSEDPRIALLLEARASLGDASEADWAVHLHLSGSRLAPRHPLCREIGTRSGLGAALTIALDVLREAGLCG
jgi:hypothetical protein